MASVCPRGQGMTWSTSQNRPARAHPGARQCPSRVVTNRRRPALGRYPLVPVSKVVPVASASRTRRIRVSNRAQIPATTSPGITPTPGIS